MAADRTKMVINMATDLPKTAADRTKMAANMATDPHKMAADTFNMAGATLKMAAYRTKVADALLCCMLTSPRWPRPR